MIFNCKQKTLFAKRFKNRFKVKVFFVGDATRIHFLFDTILRSQQNRKRRQDRTITSKSHDLNNAKIVLVTFFDEISGMEQNYKRMSHAI